MSEIVRRHARPLVCLAASLSCCPALYADDNETPLAETKAEATSAAPALPAASAATQNKWQIPSFGAGIKAGTLGAGLDVTVQIKPTLNLRFNLNRFNYDYDDVTEHSAAEGGGTETTSGEINLATTGLLLDYHPWGGSFRLSAGVYSQGTKAKGQTTGEILDQEIGDRRYDIEGTAYGKLSMASAQPYLGIGWGNTPRKGFPLSVSLDLGVLLNPNAKVSATVEGQVTDLETGETFDLDEVDRPEVQDFQDNLSREIEDANNDIDDALPVYPVISFGINYRFM
ncbi:hypothetical protein Q4485_16375 [Granulosicoccaceae sp. 1_MG-2023]|nr:hypothetical protein [Granulosicoccaceae sp. 1_MG-2023]